MKSKLAVVASLTFAAGFAAGLFGNALIAPARAAEDRIILVTRDAEIANKCNFNKTIVRADNSTICVYHAN
jgi:hypothetical protein